MRLPVRLPEYRLYQRWVAAAVIAASCALVGVGLWAPVRVLAAVGMLDHVFYDALFRLRPLESKQDGPIVIVAVNDKSLAGMQELKKVGWPWPRDYWGKMVTYLDHAGAKAVVFDLLFDGSSVRSYPGYNDDEHFAAAIDDAEVPVVLASAAQPDGTMTDLVPPIRNKLLGAVNIYDENVIRTYAPTVRGHPSLALETLRQIKGTSPKWAEGSQPFNLRYYGPHERDDNPVTFKYVRASELLEKAENPDRVSTKDVAPEVFKDKVVFVATITRGTYDVKSCPLSQNYPGVEVHATALQNMLSNQRVEPVGTGLRVLTLLVACLASAVGTIFPPRVPAKVLGGVGGVAVVWVTTGGLFLGSNMRWMPPAASSIAATLSAFVGLSYSYLTELRQRRFILKAFGQIVSKEVADEIAKDPRKLELGGQRREMSVMFTDLANFTSLTETLKDEKLTKVLQFYLEEMSGLVLGVNGTLDKYIGDAIMAFWNAPLDQPDHALRACRAAIEMRRREAAIQPKLREMAAMDVYSRIGINSGPMFVGNLGSSFKFSYTVIGDAVNLASRLEGANKMYGTRIILSEPTALLVRDRMRTRRLDLLRVQGKRQPMGVYELICEDLPGAAREECVRGYEGALSLYQTRRFDEAAGILAALLRAFPEDRPTATLLSRIEEFRDHPPGPDWDGVYVAKGK